MNLHRSSPSPKALEDEEKCRIELLSEMDSVTATQVSGGTVPVSVPLTEMFHGNSVSATDIDGPREQCRCHFRLGTV